MHNMEPWVSDALDMLTEDQRNAVMAYPMQMEQGTDVNADMVTRMKEVVPTEQRLQMFIKINELADGVVDRLSTITPDQQEKVMECSLKIYKANNPSGVAMKRISDVLRNDRLGVGVRGGGANSLGGSFSSGPHVGRARSRSPRRGPSAPGGPHKGTGQTLAPDVAEFTMTMEAKGVRLEWWVSEVLNRMSLWQRQNIMKDIGSMHSVRNPSGIIMSRVKAVVDSNEILSIFIDLNSLDRNVADELWGLTPDQQSAVIAPGIYVQNARNPSTAVRSRIQQVSMGNDAMGSRRTPAHTDNQHQFSSLDPGQVHNA